MVLECSASLGLHVPWTLTSVPRTHCMCVAGASLCSYSAPGLRWFLATIRETRVVSQKIEYILFSVGSLGVRGAWGWKPHHL